MRRSCAPSMRIAAKRKAVTDEASVTTTTIMPTYEDEESYDWGTGNAKQHQGDCSSSNAPDKENNFYKNILLNKRIFKIVWRDVTMKKHKTWTGDGVLEVDIKAKRAVIKDDTGKYMGCTNKVKLNELVEDYEMTVGGKEIQLLDEISSTELYAEMRKQQMTNRAWHEEEWQPAEVSKKPKGAYIFKCSLILDRPQFKYGRKEIHSNHEQKDPSISFGKEMPIVHSTNNNLVECNEYICLLRPSELQVLLLDKANKIYKKHKEFLLTNGTNNDIYSVLQNICNHPSLITQTTTANLLASNLERYLPDWTEMGQFDSTKLEFIQYFLATATVEQQQHCLIVCSDKKCLNMLNGLCDYMDLKCLRFNEDSSEQECLRVLDKLNEKTKNNEIELVLLINAKARLPNVHIKFIANIIYFDFEARSLDFLSSLTDVQKTNASIYHLITSGCYEEKVFKDYLLQKTKCEYSAAMLDNLLDFQAEPNTSGLHDSFDCHCSCDGQNVTNVLAQNDSSFYDLKQWKHFAAPFAPEFLEDANLVNIGENLVFIFSRKLNI